VSVGKIRPIRIRIEHKRGDYRSLQDKREKERDMKRRMDVG